MTESHVAPDTSKVMGADPEFQDSLGKRVGRSDEEKEKGMGGGRG